MSSLLQVYLYPEGIVFSIGMGKPNVKFERKNQQLKYVFNKAKKQGYPINLKGLFDSFWFVNAFRSLMTWQAYVEL